MREKKHPNSAERLYKIFIYLVLIMLAVSHYYSGGMGVYGIH